MRRTHVVRAALFLLSILFAQSAITAEAYELFSTLSNRLVKVEMARRDLTAPQTNSPTLFTRPNTSGSEFLFVVQNQGNVAVELALPRYLIASFPTKTCPNAPCSTNDYLVFVPGNLTLSLKINQGVTNRILHLFFLGQPDHRPPAMTDTALGTVKQVAQGSGYARLSDELLKSDPPNTNRVGQILFYIVAGTLSGPKLEDVLFSIRYSQVCQMKPVLREIGLDPEHSPPFQAADRKYQIVLAQLKTGLTSPELAGTTIANLPTRFLEGDVDATKAFIPYLAQSADELHRELVISTLEKLAVDDTAVLNALFQCALTDPSEQSRMSAALAGARLGDVRSVPLLMQYLGNVTDSNQDTKQIRGECVSELDDWRAKGREWVVRMKVEDLGRSEFVQQTPYKDVSADDMKALRTFLAENRNFHREPFELVCGDAIDGLNASTREEALRRLAQTTVHQSNPRVLEVLIDRLRNDPDVSVRRVAAGELWAQRDTRVAPALADSLKVETDAKLKNEIWEFLQRRREQKLDSK